MIMLEDEPAMFADTPSFLRHTDIEFKEKFKVVDDIPFVSTYPMLSY